jgi:hypothetical protein
MTLWILLALVLDLLFTIGTYGSSERLRHNVETLTADDRRLRASATTRTDTQTQDAFQSIVDALPEIDRLC